ncbi:hypothetical protein Bca52824_032198 [Brassica carinata]|uniref:Uncharacterized protein n=1 Tax=Brassica carinata TaxID=52824 RepID=A0A8X7SC14_BRACI|nr:hypothetical protein Bca52824_032198 [Brassica carinata]
MRRHDELAIFLFLGRCRGRGKTIHLFPATSPLPFPQAPPVVRNMLWVDKYRPKSLDKVIIHEEIAQNLKKLVRPFGSSLSVTFYTLMFWIFRLN